MDHDSSKTFLNRQITFRLLNRKELSNNKRVDLIRKYKAMDAFDQDRNFWNLMTPPLQADRGYYSRKVPLTPMLYRKDNSDDELYLLGDLNKRPLNEVVNNVRVMTTNVCVDNGFIDLRKIEWSNEYQEEEIEEIKSVNNKYKMIEAKDSSETNQNSLKVNKK